MNVTVKGTWTRDATVPAEFTISVDDGSWDDLQGVDFGSGDVTNGR
jgi:hypothetical protein